MATVVTFEEKQLKRFVKGTKKATQVSRLGIFKVLSIALDHIRHVAAEKYVIKNAVGKRMSPWAMAKKQPPHPTRLTERTGRMLDMMRHDKKWTGFKEMSQTRATVSQQTMALKGRILAVKSSRNTGGEMYEATLRANIHDSNPFIGKGFSGGGRILAIQGKNIIREHKKETKRTLHARFLHEHGIRGHKRQSFTPAAKDEDFRLQGLFEARLNRILAVASKYGA